MEQSGEARVHGGSLNRHRNASSRGYPPGIAHRCLLNRADAAARNGKGAAAPLLRLFAGPRPSTAENSGSSQPPNHSLSRLAPSWIFRRFLTCERSGRTVQVGFPMRFRRLANVLQTPYHRPTGPVLISDPTYAISHRRMKPMCGQPAASIPSMIDPLRSVKRRRKLQKAISFSPSEVSGLSLASYDSLRPIDSFLTKLMAC